VGTFPKLPLDMTTETPSTADELLTVETVGPYLVARGVFPDAEGVEATELGGGVSNVVLAASRGDQRVVVKQALGRLRVHDEWLATRERAINEGEALRVAARIAPGCVPAAIDIDRERCALTIEAAPEGWVAWKERLLDGDADPAVASRLGDILAALHRETFRDDDIARTFGDAEAFDQLRIDPYYRTVARRLPELAAAIDGYVTRMQRTRVCLVHGDYSPKNVLVGDGVWAIDFEVAHLGDPVFDIAFMLNHLLLKGLVRPGARDDLDACARAFWTTYSGAVPADLLPDVPYLLGHVGCLMVARVDGKSPAEYLSSSDRETARALGSELLLAPPDSLDAALAAARRATA
jgi:aminoglycoside phosphotransferase (APT) family kinase protein